LIIPVEYSLINEIVVFVNGQLVTDFTSVQFGSFDTRISFGNTYGSTDLVTVTAMGIQTPQYSWSVPQTQYFVSDGSTLSFTLDNSLEGTNPANIIVEKNGVRARPAEGVEYYDDGSSLQYYLPTRGGYDQALIADNDVLVYVNNQPLILNVGFIVDAYIPGQDRTVTLLDTPQAGAQILISVETAAQYYMSGNTLIWKTTGSLIPIAGDIISVTSWNDTAQQNILTQVFNGPTTQGVTVSEGYDTTDFDVGATTNDPGSFDFSAGVQIATNSFDTGRIITDPSRLQVTLDGIYLFNGNGFTVNGSTVIITGPAIDDAQVVAISSFTESVVPAAIAFRIFQDMRGLQSTYRITNAPTTT
jgi:hypothetical protein